MVKRLGKWSLTSVSGALVILVYCLFTLVSWVYYPYPYSPQSNYLSRLGNFDYNPSGAIFYNLGCIFTGLVLVPFFVSLYWLHSDYRIASAVLRIGLVFGVLSAIALIMIGVYSEDQGSPHMQASSTFFLLNFVVLLLVNIALLFHHGILRPVPLYGLVVDLSSLVFAFTTSGPLLEWYTVFGALLFVGFLAFNTQKLVFLQSETSLSIETE
ncbi:MAG: hypothetical protein JSW61_02775 [Candidatus Thorarchaeota archaeon]|nr:MAG: hypothetical protein JSW61_02775 [Candidatus Thorarchaeota archaeon]